MSAFFSEKAIAKLNEGRRTARKKFNELREKLIYYDYKSARGREFAHNGFSRRLGTMVRSIDIIYQKLPPELDSIPSQEDVIDATIAIQSLVLNAFGCLDNLAWIWVCKKPVLDKEGKSLDPMKVGLGKKNKEVRATFSVEFNAYLNERQKWVDHLKDFRDSLAHRVPLYIPPYMVDPKNADEYARLEKESWEALRRRDIHTHERLQDAQRKLCFFRPWMTHSFSEESPKAIFHSQVVIDYLTIDEFGNKMLTELAK
jgi:hypothetical protein